MADKTEALPTRFRNAHFDHHGRANPNGDGYLWSAGQVMPQSELVSIEEAGHMVPVTHFAKIAHHLFEFFDRL